MHAYNAYLTSSSFRILQVIGVTEPGPACEISWAALSKRAAFLDAMTTFAPELCSIFAFA